MRQKPGRVLMNMQLTTYSNTFLLTRNQILQRRTVWNTLLPIQIYDSWGVTYETKIKPDFNLYINTLNLCKKTQKK